jgi:hypothetical protein
LINGYVPALKQLKDKRFVTLTLPNCTEKELPNTLKLMAKTVNQIREVFKKDAKRNGSKPLVGIRKLEITFNPISNTFHPHYHFIVDGETVANELINEWLKRLPTANIKAQDQRPGDDNSVMELFKYFTKMVSKKNIYINALDVIFKSMRNKRVFQPMGIKKNVDEDILEIQKQVYSDLEDREATWTWIDSASDWVCDDELLTGYTPTEHAKNLIKSCICYPPKKSDKAKSYTPT